MVGSAIPSAVGVDRGGEAHTTSQSRWKAPFPGEADHVPSVVAKRHAGGLEREPRLTPTARSYGTRLPADDTRAAPEHLVEGRAGEQIAPGRRGSRPFLRRLPVPQRGSAPCSARRTSRTAGPALRRPRRADQVERRAGEVMHCTQSVGCRARSAVRRTDEVAHRAQSVGRRTCSEGRRARSGRIPPDAVGRSTCYDRCVT